MFVPKVSICIPAYKQTDLLDKCIDSVLMQDMKDYEIVICDDTPDDLVKNFLQEKNIKGLRYYKNEVQMGTPENWNCVVEKAEGKYIKLLHHDDFFTRKNSLSSLVQLLDNNPEASFAFCATEVWNVPSNQKRIHCCSPKQFRRIKQDPDFLFFRNVIGAPSVTLYKRNVEINYDKRLKWLPDIDFYIRMFKKHNGIVMTEEPLVCTADGAGGQVTQQVVYDKQLQIKEHVFVFEKQKKTFFDKKKYMLFFDELFSRFNLNNMQDLRQIVEISPTMEPFFLDVFAQQNKGLVYKKIKNWFYSSRFNNQWFHLEKY